jgi:hypothetical protein
MSSRDAFFRQHERRLGWGFVILFLLLAWAALILAVASLL